MKYLVETTGSFMLVDTMGRQEVQASRPTVVKATDFIEKHIGKNLKKLDTLHDDADDALLARASSDDELKAAVDALPRHENTKPAAKATAKAKE